MDKYDESVVPSSFGLNNTGVICYINSLLQMLVSCTAFIKVVLANKEYMAMTRTGKAMYDFVFASLNPSNPPVQLLSQNVLSALVEDLKMRKPKVHFGAGQESASEALVLLLEMIEPTGVLTTPASLTTTPPTTPLHHPISDVFRHRYICRIYCDNCKKTGPESVDTGVILQLFGSLPKDEAEFTKLIRSYGNPITECECEHCGSGTRLFRCYQLALIPEVVVCSFNIYGERPPDRYFPDKFSIPAKGGGSMSFKLVAQVEHSGTLSGGHYVARGLRKNGIMSFNDLGTSPSTLSPSPNTYMAAYHYV